MRWLNRNVEDITAVDILALKEEMLQKKCDKGYINSYLSIIRMFLAFCIKFHKLKVLEPEEVVLLSEPYKPVEVNNKEEVDELFKFFDGVALHDYRNRAILALVLDSGLRCCEWTSLNRDQYKEIMQGETEVTGKGGKVRTAFFTWSREYLKEYIDRRTDDHEALFVTHCRDYRWRTCRLAADGFRGYLRKARRKIHIASFPHKLRKTAITNWVENGMELHDAADCAGHRNINTTKLYYVRVKKQRLKEKHRECSQNGITVE